MERMGAEASAHGRAGDREALRREAIDFVKEMQELYFEKRALHLLPVYLEDQVSWIGTGEQEICHNLEEAVELLTQEFVRYPGRFTRTRTSLDAVALSDCVCVVYGEIEARSENPALADLRNRYTVICVREPDGMRLAHVHLSRQDDDQEPEASYVQRRAGEERETLRRRAEETAFELRERNREMEALMQYTPGGLHCCRVDAELHLLSMSQSFLKLTGYTRSQVSELFHDCFAEMIFPADRERIQAELKNQLEHGNTARLEYRIRRGDGAVIWILDQGTKTVSENGDSIFYCILVDITRERQARERLRLSLERHQIIMNQATDIIFEWNIQEDTLLFSNNWVRKFGYEAVRERVSTEIPRSGKIHPEDMPAFIRIMNDVAAGVPYSEAELRIQDVFRNFIWCRVRATCQYDGSGQPVKVVGVIVDIDADKKQREQLLAQACHDPLTGLLNREAARSQTTRLMEGADGGPLLFLIIDLDDFKGINDRYGHLYGDTVLADVAGMLRHLFQKEDVLARIGGDEFLICMPGGTREEVESRLAELRTLLMSGHMSGPQLSCSVGVSSFPQDGRDFTSLYRKADCALYQMKRSGKRGVCFFRPEMEKTLSGEAPLSAANAAIDSDSSAVSERLGQYVFRMLYQSMDVEYAVQQLLEIVGRAYEVSRVYIFENSEDCAFCSNTFEWCADGVEPEMERLQGLSYKEDLGDYLSNFDENGIFYCRDISQLNQKLYRILAPQGICAILQCAIMDDGVFRGYVGFDECRKSRSWTQEQIASLTLIASVLSTFLMKLRFKQRLERLEQSERAKRETEI